MINISRIIEKKLERPVPFNKRTLIQKFLSMIRPFDYEFKKGLQIQDAIYFPQRLIATLLLGIVMYALSCYTVFIISEAAINR